MTDKFKNRILKESSAAFIGISLIIHFSQTGSVTSVSLHNLSKQDVSVYIPHNVRDAAKTSFDLHTDVRGSTKLELLYNTSTPNFTNIRLYKNPRHSIPYQAPWIVFISKLQHRK